MSTSTHRAAATSLIEVLVVIAVIGILLSIVLPALSSVRAASRSVECLARIRQLGDMVSVYAAESRDSFPALLDGREYRGRPERWSSYTFQTFSTLPSDMWLEWSQLGTDAEVLYCPENQQHPDNFQEIASPDYVLSACVFGEAKYFSADMPEGDWRSRLGDKVQTIGAVTFPSRKVGLLELFVWHGWDGSHCAGCSVGDLEYTQSQEPGSLWFVDGHAEQMYATDALPHVYRYPTWPHMPFGTTVDGVAGRDR